MLEGAQARSRRPDRRRCTIARSTASARPCGSV